MLWHWASNRYRFLMCPYLLFCPSLSLFHLDLCLHLSVCSKDALQCHRHIVQNAASFVPLLLLRGFFFPSLSILFRTLHQHTSALAPFLHLLSQLQVKKLFFIQPWSSSICLFAPPSTKVFQRLVFLAYLCSPILNLKSLVRP